MVWLQALSLFSLQPTRPWQGLTRRRGQRFLSSQLIQRVFKMKKVQKIHEFHFKNFQLAVGGSCGLSILRSHILKHAICSGAVQVRVWWCCWFWWCWCWCWCWCWWWQWWWWWCWCWWGWTTSTINILWFLQGQVSVTSVGGRQVHPIIMMLTLNYDNTASPNQMITPRWGWKEIKN